MSKRHRIVVSVEPEVSCWARVKAARDKTSVSELIGGLLKERMQDDGYEAAKRRFLSVAPRVLSEGGGYPSRDELHDRARLR